MRDLVLLFLIFLIAPTAFGAMTVSDLSLEHYSTAELFEEEADTVVISTLHKQKKVSSAIIGQRNAPGGRPHPQH